MWKNPEPDQACCAAAVGIPVALVSILMAVYFASRSGLQAGDALGPFIVAAAGSLGALAGVGLTLAMLGYRFGPIESEGDPTVSSAEDEAVERDSNDDAGDKGDKFAACNDVASRHESRAPTTGKSRFANWRPAVKIIGFGMLVIVVVNSVASHRYTAVAVTLIPMAVLIAQAVIWLRRRRSRQPIVARGKRRNRQSGR